MRRITLILATTVAALVLASAGVALAANVVCGGGECRGTNKADTMQGTNKTDAMYGRGGLDTMYGRYGADEIRGGDNADTIFGGYGDDRISAGSGVDTVDGEAGSDFIRTVDGQRDSVSCGIGNDRAIIDEADLDRASFEDFVRLTSCEDVRVR